MATFGNRDIESTNLVANQNVHRLSKFTLLEDGDVTKITVYVSGDGPGTGSQVMRCTIYDDTGTSGDPGALVAESNEITVTDGQAAGWVDATLPSPVNLPPGDYWLGQHWGTAHQTIQGRIDGAGSGSRKGWNDTYSDGADDPAPAATSFTGVMSMYATYTPTTPLTIDFPSTDVIDDFNRADAAPLNTSWSGPTRDDLGLLDLVSNRVAHDGSADQGAMYYDPQTYELPLEGWVEIPVFAGISNGVYYCIQNPGGPNTLDCYSWQSGGSGGAFDGHLLFCYRVDNGVFTEIGGPYFVSPFGAYALGVRLLADGTHELYHRPDGQDWQLVDEVVDTTYDNGFLGITASALDAAVRLDNFGGGTIAAEEAESGRRYKRFYGPAHLPGVTS